MCNLFHNSPISRGAVKWENMLTQQFPGTGRVYLVCNKKRILGIESTQQLRIQSLGDGSIPKSGIELTSESPTRVHIFS